MTALLTSAAGASAPPGAITGGPGSISVDAVTLTGVAEPAGLPANWYFQYGTSTAYGADTAVGQAGESTGRVPVSIRIGGLVAATTYHYRLVVRNHDGAAYGADASFRTTAVPPAVLRTGVSSVRDTTVAVSATVDPYGLPTAYAVHYGTSAALGATTAPKSVGTADAAINVATTVARLAPNTTYDVQVVATNAAGTRSGPMVAFTTTGPPAVANQAITDLATTSARLGGVINPDGHATSWYAQYGATASYGASTPLRHLGGGTRPLTVAAPVASLMPNTTYHFRLVATSAAGTVTGADATFTTPGPTLSASASVINFGRALTLSGSVPNGQANETVTIYAQPTAAASFAELTTVLTGSGGTWAYDVSPGIDTSYKAMWDGEVSPIAGIGVSPSVLLREPSPHTFTTRVSGQHPFTGRLVRLQRLDRHGIWRTVAAERLDRHSTATFHPNLSSSRSRLRVYFTAFQAGPGYLASTSGVHTYRG